MKIKHSTNRWPTRLAGVALIALGAAAPLCAATFSPWIEARPLTPQEKKDYNLASLQGASGLSTIGIGQPAYLEALLDLEQVPAGEVTRISWDLTKKPIGSSVALAESPLGANVPTYKMADRESTQVAGRKLLTPDVTGQYTVTATIETATKGTNAASFTITAGTFMGIDTCKLCHSGGMGAANKYTPWSQTPHSSLFTRGIDGIASDHYGKNCISCHTVGYDVNTNAVNGGFDDVAAKLGWTFPTNTVPGNWAATPAALKNVANIQCENCHGPGSEHAKNLGATDMISASFASGVCAQCHASKNNHIKNIEWDNSRHAVAVREEGAGCVGCHTGPGFADRTAGVPEAQRNTEYEAIGCSGCHEPHDITNPNQLRTVAPVTLMDKKTTITKGGKGLMCMNCHMTRRDAATYAETTPGSSRFGPHHGPQADMLAGANAVTYGKVIPSSAHRDVVEESCVECHMQAGPASTSPAFTKTGGHTFTLSWPGSGTNGPVHLTEACKDCHGEVESFDFVRQDYDGNGVLEGVQTEVKGLLNKLALLLPPVGQPKTSLSIAASWTRPQLKAAYNYQFVLEDGSFGVHNLSYAVGLLKASIADLTGDANNDSLPDSWQIANFGSISSPDAAPNATPAGDGVPNWLKYSLGLDPKVAGVVLPSGVVWANGKTVTGGPINPGDTNAVAIFTAAEVAFQTEVGKTYQVQGVSSLSGGWSNIGQPIVGNGSSMSYVTPTRQNVQQFYRVLVSP